MITFKRILIAVLLGVVLVGGYFWNKLYLPSLTRAELAAYEYEALTLPNGMRVNYRESGNSEGQPLLMVHGGSDSLGAWEHWSEPLSEYRLIALDLPGHGLTDPFPDLDYARPKMAAFLNDFITQMGLEDIIVMAHSMGGEYSLKYTIDHQDNVKAIVVVAPGVYRDDVPDTDSEAMALNLSKYPFLVGILSKLDLTGGGTEEGARAFFEEYVGVSPEEAPVAFERGGLLGRYEANRKTLLMLVKGMYDEPYYDGLDTIEIPMLIIWGTEDEVSSYSLAARLQSDAGDAELVTHEGVGHTVMTVLPDGGQDVLEFLTRRGLN